MTNLNPDDASLIQNCLLRLHKKQPSKLAQLLDNPPYPKQTDKKWVCDVRPFGLGEIKDVHAGSQD